MKKICVLGSTGSIGVNTLDVINQHPDHFQATILASSVMYLRILALVAILNPDLVAIMWYKLLILASIGGVLAIRMGKHKIPGKNGSVESPRNPFEIRPALVFSVLFVIMSVITVLIKEYYGNTGLMTLAAITGVTDIDPFILIGL